MVETEERKINQSLHVDLNFIIYKIFYLIKNKK